MDDRQVIFAIARAFPNDAERIAMAWAECQEVRSKLRNWANVAGQEIARHKKAMDEIALQEMVVRSTCSHWHTVMRESDGSSYRECDICGEVWR